MKMSVAVDLSLVRKQLAKMPYYIVDKLHYWARSVERFGIYEVRKIPGFHDEPLMGRRMGQRSIRLSRAYRAIYTERDDGTLKIIQVIEVSKHEY